MEAGIGGDGAPGARVGMEGAGSGVWGLLLACHRCGMLIGEPLPIPSGAALACLGLTSLCVQNVAMFHRLNTYTVEPALQHRPEQPSEEFLSQFGIVMVAVADYLDETKIRYIDWAMLSCQSVRKNGRYNGPLYLVTNYDLSANRYRRMISMYNISVIKVHVPPGLVHKNKMQGQRFKMVSGGLVPDEIRYLLYIDADVLIGNNLDRFLGMGESYMQTCTMLFFQGRNRSQKPNQPFQGGTFFVDLKYGMPFLHEWERILFAKKLPKDQMALYLTVLDRLSEYSADTVRDLAATIKTKGSATVVNLWNKLPQERKLTEVDLKDLWWDGEGEPPKEREMCVISHKHDWVLFPFPDNMRRGEKNDLTHITFTGFLRKVTEEELLVYLRTTLRLDPSGLSLYFPVPYDADLQKAALRPR